MAKQKVAQSPRYKLNKEDGMKILKGAGIALGGTLVTYLLETIPAVDFGAYTPMVVGVTSILLNSLRKWLSGQ